MSDTIIRAVNLNKSFKRANRDFFVIKDINFSIKESEFVHIIGRSGSGKTTLLNLLTGILTPDSGEVYIEEKSLFEMSDSQKSDIRNSTIGFVPQSLGTLPNLNVIDNVRLPYFLGLRVANEIDDAIDKAAMLLDLLGILDLKDDYCQNLSGGELKRVMIARALMNDAKLLIADEPTADLDIETTKSLMETFVKLNKKGIAIIIVTHELDLLKYGNSIYEMKNSELLKRKKYEEK